MKSRTPFDTIDIQEKNAMICRFMGGEIIPFKMPDAVVNTWQECEVQFVNGQDSDRNLLMFHSDWNHIMQVWEKIISLNKSHLTTVRKGQISFDRVEINKSSILLCCERWESRILGWSHKDIYHFHKAEFYTKEEPDCKDMKEVYYKSIIDFIEWYNEKYK